MCTRVINSFFFALTAFAITSGFSLENHYDPPDIITPLDSRRLEDFHQSAWRTVLADERKIKNEIEPFKLNSMENIGVPIDFAEQTITSRIPINTIRSTLNVSKDKLRRSKTKHHRKTRGKGKRIRKDRKKSRLNSKKIYSQQIFRSVDLEDNVEHELTKNLENEIIKSRLTSSLINSRVGDIKQINEASKLGEMVLSTDETTKKINESTEFVTETIELGDLSCMNGKFIPAPLVPHALIKYVKSSKPGHEYLEADYECMSGFSLSSNTSRLFCKNRDWIGDPPSCVVKNNLDVCSRSLCEQLCNEVNGQARCSCYKGFQMQDDKCLDINECDNSNGGCQFTCTNTPGSFRCNCPTGMKHGGDKYSCIDIDECLLNNGHGPCQDTCQNLEGGYVCSCENLPGTVLSADNHTCQDAGPCALDNAGCSHTCLSTIGRVFCLCPDGYMLQDDWKTCEDVDECAVPDLQSEVCRFGCLNTPGSYHCTDPLELKDQTGGDDGNSCPPGYQASSRSSCIDINECNVNNGGCTEVCENTDGSYFCACNGDEKILSPDGKSCSDINLISCPPLAPTTRGSLICSRQAARNVWSPHRAVSRPGTKCYLKCPRGYQLLGEYQLTCHGDGAWSGIKTGECVKLIKPHLECPKDVLAEVPPDRDEAFIKFDQPSTDLDWFRYVRSKPSWGMRLEASLKPGLHIVTFLARDPASKKQSSCAFRIAVQDGEPPKAHNCPKDIVKRNGTSISWTEPTFTDNIKVTRISSNETPGRSFDVGQWKIIYQANDDAGWSTNCTFNIIIQ